MVIVSVKNLLASLSSFFFLPCKHLWCLYHLHTLHSASPPSSYTSSYPLGTIYQRPPSKQLPNYTHACLKYSHCATFYLGKHITIGLSSSLPPLHCLVTLCTLAFNTSALLHLPVQTLTMLSLCPALNTSAPWSLSPHTCLPSTLWVTYHGISFA